MHGALGKSAVAADTDKDGPASSLVMLLLVAMTRIAPISLYLLVPALPKLAVTFGRYLDRAADGIALSGRHRLFPAHHGAAVGPASAAARYCSLGFP